VAFLTLDQRRIEEQRDGLLPCIVHKKWEPAPWSQKEWGKIYMKKIAAVLEYKIVQLLVLGVTAGLLTVGIKGMLFIAVEFDPVLLLPGSSYLRKFINTAEEHFPKSGETATIYTGRVDYTISDFTKIDRIVSRLDRSFEEDGFLTGTFLRTENKDNFHFCLSLVSDTDFWWSDLKKYLKKRKGVDDWKDSINDGSFQMHLSDFLYHTDGAQSKRSFKFVGDVDLECSEPSPPIKVARSVVWQ
jgi:hypothetical protein